MGQAYPLYDARMEHDACGVGAVVELSGRTTHAVVADALSIVERLAHRAGCDALGTTGDGVGILTQIPHALFERWARAQALELGPARGYGVGMFFLPRMEAAAWEAKLSFEAQARREGIEPIAWRAVPCHPELLGEGALATMPRIEQCFLARPDGVAPGAEFDRRLYLLRRAFERDARGAYVCSLSSRTIVYKGMMRVDQLRAFYDDLRQPDYVSAVAMVHSRFSTNTQPSWPKAHPHRMLLHNGEINTIRGNADRMLAREETLSGGELGAQLRRAYPVVTEDGSDSMMLDNALEFLAMSGVELPLAGMMLLPEPWQGQAHPTPWRDMYRYYATMMEPWDGPAATIYTDGDTVCASLDRNGLRPLRCAQTDDGRLILSSEAGVLYEAERRTVRRWRLRAGDALAVDLQTGQMLEGAALKERFAARLPYGEWVRAGVLHMSDLPQAQAPAPMDEAERLRLCRAFGYAAEDVQDVIRPMAEKGTEPIGAMGADEPIAALSRAHPPLSAYFKQRFAQVTNPPIDALRERQKTDCSVYLGDDGNLLEPGPDACRVLELASPVLTEDALARVRALDLPGFRVETLTLCYAREDGMERALQALFQACDAAYARGANIVVLSDRGVRADRPALPSLLAVSALEQYLVRTKKRTAVSVVIESAEARDSHQMALLVAYGARAVCPYLAHACVRALCAQGKIAAPAQEAVAMFDRTLTDGVLHIAAKMGVSTIQAYQSAQLFEAVGLNADLVERYFTNTPHRLGGVNLARIEADALWHHDRAFALPADAPLERVGRHRQCRGEHAEEHLYSPQVIDLLQRAVRENDPEAFDAYARQVHQEGPRTLRGLLAFRFEACTPVPLEEVEPAERIVRRFKTGAMSYGSLSREAHECLAEAMNRIGGASNSGEGGELPERLGTALNSAVKQVASGRFGVTLDYLLSAREIQIKMAQGAKPGEGGHLPGMKVTPEVARTRCSTPGISLISPPPHHDIYSIEDLAQLVYDLRCVNRDARISVKLVSGSGVGTIACGVAKAGAQIVLISGGEGGTGAAPLASIHGAGLPWELGLAEAHQTLCKNGLRERVALEVDGKLMTGRDVAVALLLGAEEFSFATAPLVAMGCRMMRVCNLDTCPMGIATQRPDLRKRFAGRPEHIERFMFFVAEQLRRIMARLGARTADELVGRGDLLRPAADAPVDLSECAGFCDNRHYRSDCACDLRLDERADARPVATGTRLYNTDRAFGTMLGATLRRRGSGVTPQRIDVCGCGGQSFGAFLPKGLAITLSGEANDYLGKGLSGGTIAVRPPQDAPWHAGDALVGNVALYGATGGRAFLAGAAGERFCVRNSGAIAVAEGVGDHGCEYMTGGRAVILGPTGDNFAAGMTGGVAYVLDPDGTLPQRLNAQAQASPLADAGLADELRAILQDHAQWTDSPLARAILADFEAYVPSFKVVIPTEYRRTLLGA